MADISRVSGGATNRPEHMERPKRKRTVRRRKRRRSVLFRLVVYIIMAAVMAAGISVFFKISRIEVTGNIRYGADEIIAASGLKEGDNLIFINAFQISNKIFGQLPYVDEATISKRLPDTVVIGIEESYPLASVAIGAGYYIIDKNCKILEKTDRSGSIGTIAVKGVEPILPKVGEKLELGREAAHKVSYLSELLSLILERQMQEDIGEIDMTDGGNPTFSYLDRFTIELGRQEGIDYKLDQLNEVLELLSAGETGRIILAADREPHFIPE